MNARPVISLEKYIIEELNFKHDLIPEELESESEFKIDFQAGTTEDLKNGKVILTAKISDVKNHRRIEAKLSGYFDINIKEDIEEYLVVNGTAILFPYLRSVVSMITSLDSSDAIVIPTVNVLELINRQKEQEERE
ncbi:hypothetical protein HO543_06050 [Streptococcus suis]|mgnify:CR=1 FL=1|nr:hypothetical protein [Streptococcus suis]NQJ76913.1 hypothetical protein [Streptococcus suis]